MQEPEINRAGRRTTSARVTLAEDPAGSAHRRITPRAPRRALRCVSSGYLADGCSCRTAIPVDIVEGAWARERDCAGEGDRFFHFAWRGGIWLAYGLADGHVRGVYAPSTAPSATNARLRACSSRPRRTRRSRPPEPSPTGH
jgi:hypothetical protein